MRGAAHALKPRALQHVFAHSERVPANMLLLYISSLALACTVLVLS